MVQRVKSRVATFQLTPKTEYAFLVLITCVAFALRFYKLGEWSLWIDEFFSIRDSLSRDPFEITSLGHYPLFYLLIRPALVFLGVSEWSARLIPALIGVASMPLLYLVVKRVLGFPTAILVTALLAVHPWHIYWSQNARFYSLLLLLFNLSLFAFYWGLERDQLKYIVGSVAIWGLAMLTHAAAIWIGPLVIIYSALLKALPFEKPPGLRLRNLVVMLSPVIGYGVKQAYDSIYRGRSLLIGVIRVFAGRPNLRPIWLPTGFVQYIGLPLAFLAFLGGVYYVKEKRRLGLLLTSAAAIPIITIMALSPFFYTAYRYAFVSLPSCVILAVIGVRKLYSWARMHKSVLAWLLGVPILLLKDPVLEDIGYYFGEAMRTGLIISSGLLVAILVILFLSRSRRNGAHRLSVSSQSGSIASERLMWISVVLLLLCAHSVVADTLYFRYQHGWRNDWITASAIIRQGKVDEDIIVSQEPQLVTHYVGAEAKHVGGIAFDSVLEGGSRVWFVQNDGFDAWVGSAFEEWARANCDVAGVFDQYAGGRLWKMRVHLCDPAKLRSNVVSK